jgi:hypothetical protein
MFLAAETKQLPIAFLQADEYEDMVFIFAIVMDDINLLFLFLKKDIYDTLFNDNGLGFNELSNKFDSIFNKEGLPNCFIWLSAHDLGQFYFIYLPLNT